MIGPRLRAGAVVLFVFAAGVLAGIAFERHYWVSAPQVVSPEDHHEAAMAELRDVLDLTDEQANQIEAIVEERAKFVQDKWEQLRPELQNEMQRVHVEIAELLTPEQIALYHEWLTRQPANHGTITIVPRER